MSVMSEVGHERRFRNLRSTSAYPPRLAVKADIADRQVRANRRHSDNHSINLIRARDNCRRHSDAELLGALDVDGQFECGRLVASVGRPVEIVAGVSIGITKAADKPWRYGLKGSRSLSKPFRRSNRRSRLLMSMIFSENRYPLFQIML